MTTERDWDKLTLDEKLTELGFPRPVGGSEMLDKHYSDTSATRLHAALDQLLDAGGLITEVEAMAQPFVLERSDKAKPPGSNEAEETLEKIYELVTAGDDE